MKNASFSWENEDIGNYVINDVSMELRNNDMLIVIGKVGSGKTSLIHSIL